MRVINRCELFVVLLLAVLVSVSPVAAQHGGHAGHHGPAARDLGHVNPGLVGLSAERLKRLSAGMQQMVDDGKVAGVVTMLARHGKVAYVDVAGVQDVESMTPMAEDSIFLIYSMSKPITGVALMMLYEEGKFRLDDPVSDYIPQFANLKVHTGEFAGVSPILEAASRPMTMRDLMTHTSGLAYSLRDEDPVSKMYQDQGVLNPNASLQEMIDKLARLPLRTQPGTRFFYSISVDVQGYLVETLSGQPFDEFLLDRIFEPLGMVDTGFFVSAGQLDRAARIHTATEDGALELVGQDVRSMPPAGPSGGGGLYSTAGDYLRFMQMLANGGEFNGARLLSPRTVEMMRTNHMSEEPLSRFDDDHIRGRGQGLGWGLDFEVVMDAAAAGESTPNGTYYWGGAAGTWFWIDPASDLVVVGMIQNRGGSTNGDIRALSRSLVYGALAQ